MTATSGGTVGVSVDGSTGGSVRVANADGTTTTVDPATGTTSTVRELKPEIRVKVQEALEGRRPWPAAIMDARERLLVVQAQVTAELYPDLAKPYRFDRYADPMLMYGEPADCSPTWLARVGPRFDITTRAQQELRVLAQLAPNEDQRIGYAEAAADWCLLVTHWLNILWFALGINPRFLVPAVWVYTPGDIASGRQSTLPADLARAQWSGPFLPHGSASGEPPCFDPVAAAADPENRYAGYLGCVGQPQFGHSYERFPATRAQSTAFVQQALLADARVSRALVSGGEYAPTVGAVWGSGQEPVLASCYALAYGADAWPANRGEPAMLGAALGDLTLTNPGPWMLHGWFREAGNWRLSKGRALTDKWVIPQSVLRQFGSQGGVKTAGVDAWRWWFIQERRETRLVSAARAHSGLAVGPSPRQEVARLKAIATDVAGLDLVTVARDAFLAWAENHIRYFETMGASTETWVALRAQYDTAKRQAVESWVNVSRAISESANALLQIVGTIASLVLQIAGIVIAPLLKFVAKKGTGPGMVPITNSGPAYPQPFLLRSMMAIDCNLSGESQGAAEMLRRNETLYFPGVRPGAGGEGATAADWLSSTWALAALGAAAGVGAAALLRR